eukprot:Skav236448  [mRNA]  locus=scaffold1758:10664:15883:+ [translate_table: standard]
MVVLPLVLDPGHRKHLVVDGISKQYFHVEGVLHQGHAAYTLLNVKVGESAAIRQVVVDQQSSILTHDTCEWADLHSVIELCCGAGYMGVGAKVAGLCPILGCDQNPKFTEQYEKTHGTKTVTGNVCSVETISKIWSLVPSHTGVLAGVSCQPFSLLGDMRGGEDNRSTSLTGVLEAIHWLQAPYAILECVKPAGDDPFFAGEIDTFCRLTKYVCHQFNLDLQEVWPSKRSRWWGILVSPALTLPRPQAFPTHCGLQKISQIITGPTPIPDDELQQLVLLQVERDAFGITDGSHSKHFVNEQGCLPTALHAWGNQVIGCPCNCRQSGLSPTRLREKGLHGVIFRVGDSETFRHIHPMELAALVGVDPYAAWDDLRFDLCSLGQLASPIQSLWMCSHVKVMLAKYRGDEVIPVPFKDLQAYMSWLLVRANMIWPPARVTGDLKHIMIYWKPMMTLSLNQLFALDFWDELPQPCSIGMILDLIGQSDEESSLCRFMKSELALLHDAMDEEPQVAPTIPATVEFDVTTGMTLQVKYEDVPMGHDIQVSQGSTVCNVLEAEAQVRQCDIQCMQCECKGCGIPLDTLLEQLPEMSIIIRQGATAMDVDSRESGPLPDLMPSSTHGESGPLPNLMPSTADSESGPLPDLMPSSADGESGPLPDLMPCTVNGESGPLPDLMPCTVNGESGPLPDLMPCTVNGESGPLPDLMPCTVNGESGPLPDLMPCEVRDDAHADVPAPSAEETVGGQVISTVDQNEGERKVADTTFSNMFRSPTNRASEARGSVVVQDSSPPIQFEASSLLNIGCPVLSKVAFGESGPLPDLMPSCNGDVVTSHASGRGDDPSVSDVVVDEPCKHVVSPNVMVTPLPKLTAKSLLNLSAPVPTQLDQVYSLKQQALRVEERLQVIENQRFLWADDEIAWHLHQILAEHLRRKVEQNKPYNYDKVVVLDPLLMHGWIQGGTSQVDQWCKSYAVTRECIMTVALVGSHWVPVLMWPKENTLVIQTWDEQATDHTLLNTVCAAVAQSLGLVPTFHRFHRIFVSQKCCGALAIGFIQHMVLQLTLPQTDAQTIVLHQSLRASFVDRLQQYETCVRPWLWGLGNTDLVPELADLLRQNGVPQEEADTRAQQAIKAIGVKSIQQVLQSKTPWRQLKVLGNQNRFQLLLPSELQMKIEANAGQRKPRASRKVKNTQVESTYQLDPHKLLVAEGCFHHNGSTVGQLQLQQINPVAEGVVLASALEAEPYIRANQVVSKCPLALIVLNGSPTDLKIALPHGQITVPCRCALNKEPLLVEATIIQIGTGHVSKSVDKSLVKVDALEVSTLKLLIYRDEVSDWQELVTSPMKYVLAKVPALDVCDVLGCGCPKTHPDGSFQQRGVLLDVWRRQFLKQFKPSTPQEATVFSVCIRLPTSMVFDVLSKSGVGGIYFEPRTQDGKQIDMDFSVTWIPRTTKADVQRLKQTDDQVLGLVRLGDRWGLRSESRHAASVHSRVRPDTAFLSSGQRKQFLVGPMPYGADRVAIAKAMKSLQWDIKPLQPVSSVPSKGSMWAVLAVDDPPQNLVQMEHGEIMITAHKVAERDVKPPNPKPVASSQTIQLCGSETASGSDPWLTADPWSQHRPVQPVAPMPSAAVQQLEEKIEQAVLEKLAAATPAPNAMEQDGLPDRIQQLESNLQTLAQQHQTSESRVTDSDRRQSAQLATMQAQINHQGQQLHGAIEAHGQTMSAMFEQQMQQIRTLLSKRRLDGEEGSME